MPSWNLPWTYRSRSKVSPVHNPAFWDWFRGSVVRNPDGSPRIVYHGTTAREGVRTGRGPIAVHEMFPPIQSAFTVFQPGREDIGIHFGTREQADYIRAGRDDAIIYPVYVRLKNPLRVYDSGEWHPTTLAHRLEDYWPRPKIDNEIRGSRILSTDEVTRVDMAGDRHGNEGARVELVHILKRHGYDGIVYQNLYEGNKKDDSYIVFDPTQIKSAYGNRGTFDPNDPDILHGF